jgi:hypothetical protein
LPPTLDLAQPLVFVSHDHRDAELAEAFENLISDASAGVVKCFRSSDKLGTSGIEYGSNWYQAVMENLDEASAVVALLTRNSIDRPWILYEVGVAKGMTDTTAFGLVLGVPLDAASRGPFAQFQNSASDEDSLVKLVSQIVNPHTAPRPQIVRGFVQSFMRETNSILEKRTDGAERTAVGDDDNSAARLFEEIKILVGDIPRIANMLDRFFAVPPTSPARKFGKIGRVRLTDKNLSYAFTINDTNQIISFSNTWTAALQQMGWPDSQQVIEVLADLEKWFSDEPSRLTTTGRGQIGNLSFGIVFQDGVTVLRDYRVRS